MRVQEEEKQTLRHLGNMIENINMALWQLKNLNLRINSFMIKTGFYNCMNYNDRLHFILYICNAAYLRIHVL